MKENEYRNGADAASFGGASGKAEAASAVSGKADLRDAGHSVPEACGGKCLPPMHSDETLTPPMLIVMISRMHQNLMRNTETPGSVMSQHSCRMLIRWLAREDGLSQLELARRTGLKPPTVSVALGRMEHMGYVRREASQSDGREVRVYLTEAGRVLEEQTKARLRCADEIAMRDVTPEESETLCRILLKMKNSLAENENSADPREKRYLT